MNKIKIRKLNVGGKMAAGGIYGRIAGEGVNGEGRCFNLPFHQEKWSTCKAL